MRGKEWPAIFFPNYLINCFNRLYFVIFRVARAAAAAMGVKEERKFNFSRSADYLWPRPRVVQTISFGHRPNH